MPEESKRNEHKYRVPDAPKDDYFLDPDNSNKNPRSTGGPVMFPRKGAPDRFQQFMWEFVNHLHAINLGLAVYKRGCAMGNSPIEARKAYDAAVKNYNDVFVAYWNRYLNDYTTEVDLVFSTSGYIVDVRVISQVFSPRKPGQSSSENSLRPHPSSSSSSANG